MRFGQGVRAFLFDRVLCGEDEERLGQRVPLAADRHLTLLHRLQERRLRLWGRAIDLVREKDVGEHRTLQESEFALTCRAILMDDFGTGDVRRHEIRRELNAVEVESQASSQRVDQQRLGETRHAFENAVAASEDGDEELLDNVVLADYDAPDLLTELLGLTLKAGHEGFDGLVWAGERWRSFAGI